MIILISLVSFMASASNILTFDEIKTQQSGVKKVKNVEKKPKRTNPNKGLKKELEEAKKKIGAYEYILEQISSDPIIMDDFFIGEGELIGASTGLSIRATNTPTKVYFSNIVGFDLPQDAKIACDVYVKHKRVCGVCNRYILDGVGRPIKATLKNRDGSTCVIGKVSDSKETYLTGVAISEMAQGALALSQSSIPTVGGNLIESTASNKITQGLINVGSEATEILKEEYQTQEPIVTLDQGTSVIIEFNEAVTL